jgi:hypothetical protein
MFEDTKGMVRNCKSKKDIQYPTIQWPKEKGLKDKHYKEN